MDHPCENCGHPVEDGVPFCPHCRAAQIRVILPEGMAGAEWSAPAAAAALRPNSIQWSLALPVCVATGIFTGVLMATTGPALPWMLAGGFLAVFFYRRRHPAAPPTARSGARLGGATGVAALAVFFSLAAYNGYLREMLGEYVRLQQAMKADERFKDVAENSIEALKQPGGLGAWLFFLGLGLLLVFIVGGALGGALLGRKERP